MQTGTAAARLLVRLLARLPPSPPLCLLLQLWPLLLLLLPLTLQLLQHLLLLLLLLQADPTSVCWHCQV
jgi:hypothetical protein